MLLQGPVLSPWERARSRDGSEYRGGGKPSPQEEEEQKWWDKACVLSRVEHLYLISSRTSNPVGWVEDLSVEERTLWVSRILRDIEHEEKKFQHLTELMVKLWSSKG